MATTKPKARIKKQVGRTASCSYHLLVHKLFPERSLKGKLEAVSRGKSDEDVFVAFLKMLGFTKLRKNLPDPFKQQFLLEVNPDGEKNIRLYSLSGGPMLVFDGKGKFKEWC